MKNKSILIMLAFLQLAGFAQTSKNTVSIKDGLETARLASVNMDSFRIAQMVTEIDKGGIPNIHSVLITRHGKLVFEQYWPGKDEILGDDRGVQPHHRDSLHDIRSITKSIVAACVGIAIKEGKIKSVQQKVFDFFPEYKKYDTGWKSALTIEHLLTMTSGLVWNEDVPYDNPENSEIRMMESADPMEYVLSRDMEVEAGKVWKYNGGTTQLLATIIQKVSGKPVDQFAAANLFRPLGIQRFKWLAYPKLNLPMAASGLRLRSRDLLKFGLLYHNNGVWNGKQLLPTDWAAQSLKPLVPRGRPGDGYGYQFWIFADSIGGRPVQVPAAVGNGDQRIFFDKKRDLVVVVTAGNYNKWDIPRNAATLMQEFIVPAVIPD